MKLLFFIISIHAIRTQEYRSPDDQSQFVEKANDLRSQLRKSVLSNIPRTEYNASLGGNIDFQNNILPDMNSKFSIEKGPESLIVPKTIAFEGSLNFPQRFPTLDNYNPADPQLGDKLMEKIDEKIKDISTFPQYIQEKYDNRYDLAGKILNPLKEIYKESNLGNELEYRNDRIRNALDNKRESRDYGEKELYNTVKDNYSKIRQNVSPQVQNLSNQVSNRVDGIYNTDINQGDDNKLLEKVQLLQEMERLEKLGYKAPQTSQNAAETFVPNNFKYTYGITDTRGLMNQIPQNPNFIVAPAPPTQRPGIFQRIKQIFVKNP